MTPLELLSRIWELRRELRPWEDKDHPEWGTWGIKFECKGEWYEVWNARLARCLDFAEAQDCWEVAE